MLPVPEERSIQDDVWDELKNVRTRGLARLDSPSLKKINTPRLKAAAVNAPGYRLSLTRIAAIDLLLQYEIGLMNSSPYQAWLPVSFGLRDDLRDKRPHELREKAAKIAGDNNPSNFGRTGGEEQDGLAALAAQIVADCFTEDQDHVPSTLAPPIASLNSINSASTPALAVESPLPATAAVAVDQRIPVTLAQPESRGRYAKRPALLTSIAVVAVAALGFTLILVWPSQSGPSDNGPLSITKLLIYDAEYGNSFAFSSEDKDAAQQFIARLEQQGAVESRDASLLDDALDAGAYLYGGARLQIELEGLADREITVFNVRPVIRERHPIALEAAFLFPHDGTGGVYGMQFVLDDPSPIAKEISPLDQTPRPFFDVQRIGIPNTDKVTLVLYLYAQSAAFAFDIAIDYEVETKEYTTYINRDGKPFLASATPCGVAHLSQAGLNEEEKTKLRQLRYQAIRREVSTEDYLGMVMQPLDPEDSCV